jgi:hypothetical protein
MKPLLSILQGAIATGTGILSLGWILLGLLRPRLRKWERWVAALALGAPLYALLMTALTLAGGARRGVLTALPLALAAAAWRLARRVESEESSSKLAWPWIAGAGVVLVPFAVVALLSALAPDLTPPGEDLALAQAAQLARDGAAIPVGEWRAATPLWLSAFAIGRHSAVSAMHLVFLFGVAGIVFAALLRVAAPTAAICGAALTFTCPALMLPATGAGDAILFAFLAAAALFLGALGSATRQRALALSALLPALYGALFPHAAANAFAGFLFRPLAALPAAIPPAAFALAWFMRRHMAWLAALTLFCAITSWPPFLRRLAPGDAKTLPGVSLGVVLRRTPEEVYLEQRLDGYQALRAFANALPRDAKVLATVPLPAARFERDTLTSAALLDLLRLPLDMQREPAFVRTVKAGAESVRTYDVKTRSAAEIRFYRDGVEVARDRSWRVSAPEAFDNNPATMASGRVVIDFGGPVSFDQIRILGAEGTPVPRPPGLRRYTALALRRAGVTHLLLGTGDELYTDFRRNTDYWGVREIYTGTVGKHAAALFEIR